jgi:2-oxoglutarate ferredoxin oxidoreductase subunit alpha
MAEGLGLAGMTETPLVVIEGMRGGPATGLPTWTEQGDLKFVLSAAQGDFLRIVVAPGDAEESFYTTFAAFNLADIYQTPVIVLVDRYMCESHYGVKTFDTSKLEIDRGLTPLKFDDTYKRYQVTKDGVSARALPGSGAFFITNSDEHDEEGFSSETREDRLAQHEKRTKKVLKVASDHMQAPRVYGPQNADITIVSYGSNKGPILEALKNFSNVNYVHNVRMNPFPSEQMKDLLKSAKKLVAFENNISGQYRDLIIEKTLIKIEDLVLKYDGRPFYPEEIAEKLLQLGGKK